MRVSSLIGLVRPTPRINTLINSNNLIFRGGDHLNLSAYKPVTIRKILFHNTMTPTYSDVARKGRAHQLYNSTTGARVVAGCVVLNEKGSEVLMVGPPQGHKWVLPKGGVEDDEKDDYRLAAAREVWEEAGAKGIIGTYLGCIPHDSRNKYPIKSEFHFYEMKMTELAEKYPESGGRIRKWFNYEDARRQLIHAERFELAEALEKSSISR